MCKDTNIELEYKRYFFRIHLEDTYTKYEYRQVKSGKKAYKRSCGRGFINWYYSNNQHWNGTFIYERTHSKSIFNSYIRNEFKKRCRLVIMFNEDKVKMFKSTFEWNQYQDTVFRGLVGLYYMYYGVDEKRDNNTEYAEKERLEVEYIVYSLMEERNKFIYYSKYRSFVRGLYQKNFINKGECVYHSVRKQDTPVDSIDRVNICKKQKKEDITRIIADFLSSLNRKRLTLGFKGKKEIRITGFLYQEINKRIENKGYKKFTIDHLREYVNDAIKLIGYSSVSEYYKERGNRLDKEEKALELREKINKSSIGDYMRMRKLYLNDFIDDDYLGEEIVFGHPSLHEPIPWC